MWTWRNGSLIDEDTGAHIVSNATSVQERGGVLIEAAPDLLDACCDVLQFLRTEHVHRELKHLGELPAQIAKLESAVSRAARESYRRDGDERRGGTNGP
jgi:hypothetical protein